MISVKTVDTLVNEAYDHYRSDLRSTTEEHREDSADRTAFCDAVKANVVTGVLLALAQLIAAPTTQPAYRAGEPRSASKQAATEPVRRADPDAEG